MRSMPLMITCAEFEEFIIDYLEDRLTKKQRFIFNTHLRLCKDCRSYLTAYQTAIALGKAVFDSPDKEVPDEVPKDLVNAVLAARKE